MDVNEFQWDFKGISTNFAVKSPLSLRKYIPKHLLPLVDELTKHMEKAYYHDYGLEMKSLANALNLSLGEVVLMNLVYQVEQIGTACYKVCRGGLWSLDRCRSGSIKVPISDDIDLYYRSISYI